MVLCWTCSVCPCLSCALPQDWTQHSKCLIYAVQCSLDMLVTLLNVIQDVLGLLSCKDTYLDYIYLGHLYPQVIFSQAAFQLVASSQLALSLYWCMGLFLPE